MYKTIDPDSFGFDGPIFEQIKISNRGLIGHDKAAFEKRAATSLFKDFDRLVKSAREDEPLYHLIAMGATEYTGPNRNGDGWRSDVLRQTHPTFVKYAKFYQNHRNTDPAKSYGVVKASAFNEAMPRVELIVGFNGNKEAAKRNNGLVATSQLEKLAAGKPLPVSMSCVIDPSTLVLTKHGYKSISEVVVGDEVFTHKGRWRKVTELMRRRYTGQLVEFKIRGLPQTITLTADHPLFSKILANYPRARNMRADGLESTEKKGRQNFRQAQQWLHEVSQGAEPFSWLHVAHLTDNDRIAVQPVVGHPDLPAMEDTRFAELLGIYTAEGSLARQQNGDTRGVVFTVNITDWAYTHLLPLVRSIWPEVPVHVRPKANCAVAFELSVGSTPLSQWCEHFVGSGAKNKRIPMELFNSGNDMRLAFLGRWLDGDGFCDGKGLHWSSVNESSIMQGRDLLLSLGISASVYKINHTQIANSYQFGGCGFEYTLNVSNYDGHALIPWSKKVAEHKQLNSAPRTKPSCLIKVADRYAYRVKSVKFIDAVDVLTYNFEVEEDHSYSLLGLVSHNCRLRADICSFCGNSAPSPSHYCTGTDEGGRCKAGGLKNRMGQLREVDGDIHHLHADNPNDNLMFFDISDVHRPADRTAYVVGALTKAASAAGRAVKSAELAELLGIAAPLDVLMANLQFVNPTVAKIACDLARIESEISSGEFWNAEYYLLALKSADEAFANGMAAQPDVASELTKTARAGEAAIFSSLTRNKICLSPAAFLQVFGGYSQEKAAAWAAAVAPFLPNSFGRLLDSGCVAIPAYAATAGLQKTASHAIVGKHLDLFSVFSVAKPHVQKRAITACLQLEVDSPGELVRVKASSAMYEREAASKLLSVANTYALYKLAFATAANCDPFEMQMIVLQNYNTR